MITFLTDAGSSLAAECKKLNCVHGCKQKTTNTYECFCLAGYGLDQDSFSCSGMQHYDNVHIALNVCMVKRVYKQISKSCVVNVH